MTKNDHDPEIGRVAAEIEAASQKSRRYRKMDFWRPYPKQQEFFAATLRHREVGFFAGSQIGKSDAGAILTAYNLTGLYPKGWPGRRFDHAIDAWAVAESLKAARDISQTKLVGLPGDKDSFGSGMISKHLFVGDPVLARGEGDAIDTIRVRHVSGGVSTLRFRTYQAGRQALQGATLHYLWLDEEPDDFQIYSECLSRISGTKGLLVITFTPLLGMSGISIRYRQEHSPDRTFVQMGLDDVPPAVEDGGGGPDSPPGHIPLAERQRIIDGYPEHEREARTRGEPMLGSGRIYKTSEAAIIEDTDPLQFPNYWKWGAGMDIGMSGAHPWAYVLMCWDVDTDVIHLVAELRMSDAASPAHVQAIRTLEKRVFGRFMDFPTAWPTDAGTREHNNARPFTNAYIDHGLRMMPEPASHPGVTGQAAYSLEAGVAEIDQRERAGKWKIARGMLCYLEERRLYHRKDGEIVRLRDDTLAAARYGYMMRRYFRPLDECDTQIIPGVPGPPGLARRNRNMPRVASGMDFDLF